MLIIGERINTTRKKIQEAVEKKNGEFLKEEAKKQVNAGAQMVDVNVGTRIHNEVSDMEWLVRTVQEIVNVPLCIDSPNPEALSAGLRVHRGKAIVNSITGEKERANSVLSLVKEYKSSVVALTMDEKRMPENKDERIKIVEKVLGYIKEYDIPLEDVYFDPLVRPVSTEPRQAIEVLETIKYIKTNIPEVKTICGLSNISFGLPNRSLINRTFLSMAIYCGLDAALIDPLDREMISTIRVLDVLQCKDEYCLKYITAYREGKLDA